MATGLYSLLNSIKSPHTMATGLQSLLNSIQSDRTQWLLAYILRWIPLNHRTQWLLAYILRWILLNHRTQWLLATSLHSLLNSIKSPHTMATSLNVHLGCVIYIWGVPIYDTLKVLINCSTIELLSCNVLILLFAVPEPRNLEYFGFFFSESRQTLWSNSSDARSTS